MPWILGCGLVMLSYYKILVLKSTFILNDGRVCFLVCKYTELNCSVRVANELGKGDAAAVRFSIKVILAVSTVMGVVFSILCLAFCGQISYLFSNRQEVSEAVDDLSMILAVSILLNSIQPILSGGYASLVFIF